MDNVMKAPAEAKVVYASDQVLPLRKLFFYSLQQAFLVMTYLVILKIVLGYGHETTQIITYAFQGALVALGLAAILQALRNRFLGSGLLAPAIISAIYLQTSIVAMVQGGLPLMLGMTIFAGIVEMIISPFLLKLRLFFSTPLIGLIVTIVGFQLGVIGFDHAIGANLTAFSTQDKINVSLAGVVFCIIVGLTIWGKGTWKIVAVLVGLVCGFILAVFTHSIEPQHLKVWHEAAWISYPHFFSFHYRLATNLLVPFAICGFAASMRAMGAIVTAQIINDPKWHQPDYVSVRKGILADGAACVCAGLLGCTGISIGPSLIGLSKASGVAARSVGFVMGGILICASFFPKIILIVEMLPDTILGVALVFTASFMLLAGVQIICKKPLTVRDTIVIGVPYFIGASFLVKPEFYAHLPGYLHPFTNSVLSLTTLSAIILSLVFRIGIKEKIPVTVSGKTMDLASIEQHIAAETKTWGLAERQIQAASIVISNMIKLVYDLDKDTKNVQISLSYDQLNLIAEVLCESKVMDLTNLSISEKGLMLEEQAFSQGMGYLEQAAVPDEFFVEKLGASEWRVKLIFFS